MDSPRLADLREASFAEKGASKLVHSKACREYEATLNSAVHPDSNKARPVL
jgi:hypothetical protein